MSCYSYFADFYDTLTENAEYEKRADYIIKLLEKHQHPSGVTLDLACGTGTLTLMLRQKGLDIFGIDSSTDMLTIAQQKAFEADENIMYLHQKMEALNLYGNIDTCICSLDSINHLTSRNAVIDTFKGISKYLSPNGLFMFDANTVYKHKYILGDNCYIYDTEKVFCAWQNNYYEKDFRVVITLDFFIPDKNNYQRFTEQFSEYAYTRQMMEEMLEEAGLKIEAVYDDLSFSEPNEKSQREIYVIRKADYE